MERSMVTHRLALDMKSQAVQATITLAQYDTAAHRLIVTLRNGAETVELPPGSYALAVQNTEAGVDVLDSVTVYGAESAYPNCIVYDVTEAVTGTEGFHEAQFLITRVNDEGVLTSLASPRIAFVVKPDIMRGSDVINSEPYAAVVAAQAAAENARDKAEAVGVVDSVAVMENYGLRFTFSDGRTVETGSVRGEPGPEGAPGSQSNIHFVNTAIRVGVLDPVENMGSYSVPPKTGDVAITTDYDIYQLTVETVDGYEVITATLMGNIKGGVGPTGETGPRGVGISVIRKTSTSGLVDTYTITLTNGSTSTFTVTNGKDGEGGGTDPRRNTLLCDAELGMMHIGEGNFGVYATMPLADTMLADTEYTINGTAYTSDADGKITCSLTTSRGEPVTVVLSGSTVELLNGESLSRDYDSYKNNSVRVTLVGPGAFTCLAQMTVFQGPNGSPNEGEFYGVTADVSSVAPYRILYVICDGVRRPVMLNGNGELEAYTFSTVYGSLTLSIKGGKLTLDCSSYAYYVPDAKLTVLAESLDVGAGGGGTTGGGEKKVYYLAYGSQSLAIPSTGTYFVKIEGTSSARAWLVFGDGYVQHSKEIDCGGVSIYTEGGYLNIYPESQSVYVTVESIARFVSCFIEGTPVLLRDPVTYTLYEKPIEQVLPFEYAAFWNPAKGRIDATRVLAPPIAGDAEEFDRLYFDDGTELDVFGVQFFWNVDTDTLVDWSKMEQGTRVCTKNGDIVRFVRAEHIVPEVPVKHYTLLTYRGRYIAGGIVAGDKRDLIYPRMMDPARVRYWRMLNEADQNGLIKAHREGCRRRNWKYSKELHDALDPLKRRRRELEGRIGERKQFLADTDHRVIKFTEGVIDEAAFAPDRTRRAEARSDINRDEVEIVTVDGQIAAETERVRAEIAATWRPQYAGRFVGKNKVILEDEV